MKLKNATIKTWIKGFVGLLLVYLFVVYVVIG